MTSNAPKDELPRLFRPEFLNRVDEIIDFHRLTDDQLKRIVDIQLASLKARLAERHIQLELTDAARERLVKVGYDPAYGARPLKRAIQKEVETPLARKLVGGEIHDGEKVRVDISRLAGSHAAHLRGRVRLTRKCILIARRENMAQLIESQNQSLPLLPLKNSALFPGLMMPLAVGRRGSIAAVEAALATEGKEVVVVAQRDASSDAPGASELYTVGTRAVIRKAARPRPDHVDIMVLGMERVVIVKVDENHEKGYLAARIGPLALPDDSSRETEALTMSLVELASKFVGLAQAGSEQQDISHMFTAQQDPLQLAFMIGSLMNLDVAKEQALLKRHARGWSADGPRLAVA